MADDRLLPRGGFGVATEGPVSTSSLRADGHLADELRQNAVIRRPVEGAV
jgi:hypothetical protein